jgi:hypothetical protein
MLPVIIAGGIIGGLAGGAFEVYKRAKVKEEHQRGEEEARRRAVTAYTIGKEEANAGHPELDN